MARDLKTMLESDTDIEVILTRNDDSFVSLSERVRRAREHAADMFVSIHADSIRARGVRGATVYTLSEKASDQLSLQLATQENRSDPIAGLSLEDEQDAVADILKSYGWDRIQCYDDYAGHPRVTRAHYSTSETT